MIGPGEQSRILEQDRNKTEAKDIKSGRIADREDEYQSRRKREISPERVSGPHHYSHILQEKEISKEKVKLELELKKTQDSNSFTRKRRWDMPTPDSSSASEWDSVDTKFKSSRWDSSSQSQTVMETPNRQGRSRWDETPVGKSVSLSPERSEGLFGFSTRPESFFPSNVSLSSDGFSNTKWEMELELRNRPISDEDLDRILPSEGYSILAAPQSYRPIRTPSRKLMATPVSDGSTFLAQPSFGLPAGLTVPSDEDLPEIKQEDYQYFSKLFEVNADEELSLEDARERKIMRLLLKIKNGTPSQRRSSMRLIADKAKEFGPGPLFDQILPLLMSPALEDQERHLLVKVVDKVLFGLEHMVRPYVHKILVVIEPLLIEEDYYTRMEGREIIANLSKAAGLATMIATLRPDVEHTDEYVRNTTARAFSVVASALGVQNLLPFLRAACRSKKSWYARHTGIKIVQQIAILMGCGILPHLKSLVDCIASGLEDEQPKVRTISALAVAALAEASHPYGIESFDVILKTLWKGIREHRGKALAALLKSVGQLVMLMDMEYSNYYAKDLLVILLRHFHSPDDEMKRIVLKVLKQCASNPGVQPLFFREDIVPEFFRHFWVRRMALDRRNSKQLVDATLEIALKVGLPDVLGRLVIFLKDESEPFRKLCAEVCGLIVERLGASSIDIRMEEHLLDGLLYTFQEQQAEDSATVLHAFGIIVQELGALRIKPYIPQISSMVLWRLGNRSVKVRQLAADLIAKTASSIVSSNEENILAKISLVLYENLGEEYPDVLASILGALRSIVSVIGLDRMNPPIKDLLPRLTPILRNRHEKVQENCIELVGRIAERSSEAVSAREWMRICFELLDILKAPKKSVRRAAINTFGFIAKAIGPQDVLSALLNNLRVQERQNRVCTTIAIAIIAESCGPFTVLPALMNEYRVPELNVQNGVLKSISFLFEYIGELGRDYVFAISPLLEDALADRDQVHRQTAATAVKHIALGVNGFGCEEALLHLLNFILPNIFDASPHLINSVIEALDALRVAIGPATILMYLVQGLFHPARRIRDVYWILFNSLYLSSANSLVPYYPRVDDADEIKTYARHVLDIVI